MSETMALPPFTDASAKKTPTVYFIDDSATMREVIKIAFRRENFNVITCGDAASALSQFDQNPPDAVITDVIMPDQDGYSVCTQIKQHEKFAHIPVILMSGVVNKTVADKAVGVKADELIRKPFQPQELIGRVKALLNPKVRQRHPRRQRNVLRCPAWCTTRAIARRPHHSRISSLRRNPSPSRSAIRCQPTSPNSALHNLPRTPGLAHSPTPSRRLRHSQIRRRNDFSRRSLHRILDIRSSRPNPFRRLRQSEPPRTHSDNVPPAQAQARPFGADRTKLRAEIARLDLQVKKLQTELQIERQYNQALEAQLQALTRSE